MIQVNMTNEGGGDLQLQLTQIDDGYTGTEHTFNPGVIYDDVIEFVAGSGTTYTPTITDIPGAGKYIWGSGEYDVDTLSWAEIQRLAGRNGGTRAAMSWHKRRRSHSCTGDRAAEEECERQIASGGLATSQPFRLVRTRAGYSIRVEDPKCSRDSELFSD